MARVFVTRGLPGGALRRLAERHEVEVWPGRLPPDADALAAGVAEADGLLALLTDRVDARLIGAAPGLRAIANYAVGVDNIDLDAARARGIQVGNTPDVLTEATADLAFALLLAAARRLPEAITAVAGGDWVTWEPGRWLGAEVHGATLGIVGFGRIGRAVARRAAGFSMRVLVHGAPGRPVGRVGPGGRDMPGGPAGAVGPGGAGGSVGLGGFGDASAVSLDELLARSDFVSLHSPLTGETRHLIDARALALMRPSATLINTARGGIVDQAALADALHAGRIAAAAIDVTDPEPPASEDPLLDVPNLLITPHIGSATRAARERMAELAVENLLAALDGRPMPHPVL
jgi:glyoxylate reductase